MPTEGKNNRVVLNGLLFFTHLRIGDIVERDVHVYTCFNLELVYDVNSGSLHQVDELAGQIIQMLLQGLTRETISKRLEGSFSTESIQKVFTEIDALIKENLLFSPPVSMNENIARSYPVKALCLLLSQDCNLSCRYCFAREGQSKTLQNMPVEVGYRAVDYVIEKGNGSYREIDFFGGEPLLNFPVLQKIVHYGYQRAKAQGVELTFTLTTNATLLTGEIIDFLNDQEMSVVLSLDGRPEVHDMMRKKRCGSGSYNQVLGNIQKLLKGRNYGNYYIRGTYTKNNLDFSRDVEHFVRLGFDSISLEPVIASPGNAFALDEEDLLIIEQEYDRIVDLFIKQKKMGNPFLFYHFLVDLEQGPCLYKRITGCGAGTEYLAVAADGSLYPCHQFAGNQAYLMGNIMEADFTLNNPLASLYDSPRIHRECALCWARFLCGFGCAAATLTQAGSLDVNHALSCALQKMRLEKALYLQAIQ